MYTTIPVLLRLCTTTQYQRKRSIARVKVHHGSHGGLTFSVDSGEVVPQDEQGGEGSVRHGYVTGVV